MNKKGKTKISTVLLVLFVAILAMASVYALFFRGGISQTAFGGANVPAGGGADIGGDVSPTCDLTQKGTLLVRDIDKEAGGAIVGGINSELWSSNNAVIAGETNVTATSTSLTTNLPMYFKGFIMMGNDNYVSTTDRGTDYYHTKRNVEYGCVGTVSEPVFPLAAESTVTWTAYEDGTAETLNVTVGSSATVTTVELKIAAGSNSWIGNPDFNENGPLAIAFNVTSAELYKYDYIRPNNYASEATAPKFLSAAYVLNNKAYVLPTNAIKNYGTYRFGIVIKAATGQNPGTGGNDVSALLLDKSYFKDDSGSWASGYGYDSELGTSTDVGIGAIATLSSIAIF